MIKIVTVEQITHDRGGIRILLTDSLFNITNRSTVKENECVKLQVSETKLLRLLILWR